MPNTNPTEKKCPECGAPLSPQAPEGLCPRCVVAQSLQVDSVFTGASSSNSRQAPTPAELAPHFPQLEVLEYLGRGGMGVVYKARQKALNRLVALKLLAPERVADAKFAMRFAQEAKALAALSHSNIVTVYDFGQAGGFYYLLMEFVDGVNLRQAMQAGRFTPEQALSIVPPVCEGLQYAHEHGVVHRDIKPENLLLDREGRVKIADFGIAKMLDSEDAGAGVAESQPAGTPQYMAPEQRAHPERAGHRADIYSLGVVLYEMLTGELPAARLEPPSRHIRVDVRIDEIVLRALETKPELRYATAADFRAEVEGAVTEEVRSAAPPSVADNAGRLAGAAAVLIFFVLLTFGAMFLGFFRTGSGAAHVLMALLALAGAVWLGFKFAWVTRAKLASGNAEWVSQAHSWVKAAAWVAFLFAVPAILLGGFFAMALLNEEGGWNPSLNEAIMVPLIIAGAVLLPAAGLTLWGEEKRHATAQTPPRGWLASVLRFVFITLMVALALFGVAAAVYLALGKPAPPEVLLKPDSAEVVKNALIVDLRAQPSRGVASWWFSFEGPSLPAVAFDVEKANQEAGIEFLHPTPTTRMLSPQEVVAGSRRRVAFVLPSEAMARQAQENLRSMGPIEVLARANHASPLFEVHSPDGKLYKAVCLVASPERAREQYDRNATWSSLKAQADAMESAGAGGAAVSPAEANAPALAAGQSMRTFPLRHKLASNMLEELRPLLPADGAITAVPSANNQELRISGPAALLHRIGTFIAVVDWPDPLKNAATGGYLNDSVLRAARSFFHACATEESPEQISKLLSLAVLAELKGDAKSEQHENYLFGGAPDPAWEAALRGDWPGKDEAIRRLVAEWNRYPLKRITEDSGVAMGFGVKHFCSVSFEGAPKEFYQITIEPDRTKPWGENTVFYMSSLPPWWDARK